MWKVSHRRQESEKQMQHTLNPIFLNCAASINNLPSNTNAGLFIPLYTVSQSICWNSFHSVAITTASAFLHASMADLQIVTDDLTVAHRNQYIEAKMRWATTYCCQEEWRA